MPRRARWSPARMEVFITRSIENAVVCWIAGDTEGASRWFELALDAADLEVGHAP
jgi:hypothetical protein